MAHKTTPGTLIHCEYCGEDFSATYKRCPFCGEKPGQNPTEIPPKPREDIGGEDDYVFEGGDVFDDPEPEEDGQSGKKSDPGRRAASRGLAVNWPRLITFICSLVIIVAALVIVFAYIYPRIHGNSSTAGKETPTPPASQSVEPSQSAEPSPSEEPDTSEQPSPTPSETPSADPGLGVQSITLNRKEFTLLPDASWTVTATVNPAAWDGTVTWTSSNTAAAKVDQDGTVTNVNVGANVLRVTVTATAGDKSAEVTVYCRPGSTPSSGLGNGATGTIVNVSTYLRVRSGPGTTYDAIGRLKGGDKVTIVADAGSGWFEIDYEGGSGFIMGEYIKVD